MDIESPKNPRIVAAARLHRRRHRREVGATILEGPHVVEAALEAGVLLDVVFTTNPEGPIEARARQSGIEVLFVSDAVLGRVAGTENPRGPVAVAPIPDPKPVAPRDSITLVGVADPGNVGTIVRSAAAFGFQVVVVGDGADVWSPKVVRASAGGHFAIPLATMADDPTAELRQLGVTPVALVPTGGRSIGELPASPIALLVGSEPHGLPASVAAACDLRATLDMPGGFESLNASVAASIAMWARLQHRGS